MSRRIAGGIAAGALVVAGYLIWVDQGHTRYAAVGDCVSTPAAGRLVHAGCAGAGVLKVLAKFPGDDANRCDSVPGTTRAFVEYPKGSGAFVLCAGRPG